MSQYGSHGRKWHWLYTTIPPTWLYPIRVSLCRASNSLPGAVMTNSFALGDTIVPTYMYHNISITWPRSGRGGVPRWQSSHPAHQQWYLQQIQAGNWVLRKHEQPESLMSKWLYTDILKVKTHRTDTLCQVMTGHQVLCACVHMPTCILFFIYTINQLLGIEQILLI